MGESPHGPTATVERLTPALLEVYTGLREGLEIARDVHVQYGWEPGADPHLFHHLARRETVERLRQHAAQVEDEAAIGLPMSGLLLRPTPMDVVRVWYSEDLHMRAPDSEAGREFVTQAGTAEDLFTAAGRPVPGLLGLCKTFVRWSAQGTTVTRFTLVRPVGVARGSVVPDWSVELLPRLTGGTDTPPGPTPRGA